MDAPREQEQAPPSARRYVVVWIALLVLTATTYAASRMELGHWHLAVALAIAAAKSGLVALFFMHLWDARGTNRLVVVVALLWVALLIGGVLGDIATRYPLALPPEATGLSSPEQEPKVRDTSHGAQNQRVP